MPQLVPGCAVVVLAARLGDVVPVAAVPYLRAAVAVFTDDPALVGSGVELTPSADKLTRMAQSESIVLLTRDPGGSAAAALAGASLVAAEPPRGAGLLEAAAVMDRLRSPGGCPWDAQQTHASLRPYLVEETYELLDAIESGDINALREELGDVLLQVLFHARIAAEHPSAAFDIDDVARGLAQKLINRHPHVFARSERVASAAAQELRWEELKRDEKQRSSIVDGVAFGQPALALAAKLAARAVRGAVPVDLLPDGDSAGEVLFAVAALAKLAGEDPEGELRAVARRFASAVRAAEDSARAAGLDPSTLDAAGWRAHFPRG
jgi:XTP/dITP diphosphohydrolase